MATLDWWLKLWPLVGAIPGFIAFAWALQDRAERRKAERKANELRATAQRPCATDARCATRRSA